jgi:hypothetical protein
MRKCLTRTPSALLPLLRLYRIQERLETALEEAAKSNISYTDFLDEILSQEVASRTAPRLLDQGG